MTRPTDNPLDDLTIEAVMGEWWIKEVRGKCVKFCSDGDSWRNEGRVAAYTLYSCSTALYIRTPIIIAVRIHNAVISWESWAKVFRRDTTFLASVTKFWVGRLVLNLHNIPTSSHTIFIHFRVLKASRSRH